MAVAYLSRSSKLALAVTTAPTTTQYIVGDTLDLSGLVITATRRDGSSVDVTSQCTFSPDNGSSLSSSGTKTITITYHGKSITTTVSVYALDRIAVTTAPTKTSYEIGDAISYSGLVVKAYANNDAYVRDITSVCTKSPTQGTTLSASGSFSATISWRTKSTTQSYTVTVKIYGVEWSGGSSPTWTRTDDASGFSDPSPAVNNGSGSSPFDNILPWSGMKRVTDGYNTLVEIPKFYYKWTKNGSKIKLQIANDYVDGFSVSPAHSGRGDGKIRDYVYVGAYHSHVADSKAYSYSGVVPTVKISRATARTYCHNMGTTYWQWDYSMYWTICMLYLVEYASWDSQRKIGKGNGGTSISNTGLTDSMTYHTGTSAANRSTNGHVRYRYIEDLWANVMDWVDGVVVNNGAFYLQRNPTLFSDNANGSLYGTLPEGIGVASAFNVFEFALIPSSDITDNNYQTYSCDIYGYASGLMGAYQGSYFGITDYMAGLFCVLFNVSASLNSSDGTGCRIMKLP